jgi:hypothetical protein
MSDIQSIDIDLLSNITGGKGGQPGTWTVQGGPNTGNVQAQTSPGTIVPAPVDIPNHGPGRAAALEGRH